MVEGGQRAVQLPALSLQGHTSLQQPDYLGSQDPEGTTEASEAPGHSGRHFGADKPKPILAGLP